MGLFLCLLGPPAVGKSTISSSLADRADVQMFRLRDYAQHLRSREPEVGKLFATRDPLGWFSDGAVAYCLRNAFVDGNVPVAGVVVLENLPGSRVQVGQLHAVAAGRRVPLVLVELAAPTAAGATGGLPGSGSRHAGCRRGRPRSATYPRARHRTGCAGCGTGSTPARDTAAC